MYNSFTISGIKIGDGERPFIIAEMSGNHNQSLDRALQIVDEAAKAGANAIKLQTYTADTMTIKGVYTIQDKNSLWYGKELHDLYKEACTPWEWHKPIFEKTKKLGLIPFSSPFDASSVDFLEELDAPLYKVASFENTDLPLLKKIAATKKPVIMSTGGSTLSQIDEAVETLRSSGCKHLVLLKCTSSYPASPDNTNLLTIPNLKEIYKCPIGLSDHTMGIGVAIAAIALGASVIEKHFTLSRADGGVDAAFSLEPQELSNLVVESERAYRAIGAVSYGLTSEETKTVEFKRSIYVTQDIKKGEKFTFENIRVIRPGLGLPPKFYELILNKVAKQDLKAGTPLSWDLI